MGLGLFTITVPNQQIFVLRPRAGDHRQWPVQAEHLVDGRPALRRGRSAPRPRLHDLLHGHQPRRVRRAAGHRLARERDHEYAAAAELPRRVRRDRHRHGVVAICGSGSAAVSSARSAARRRAATGSEDDARRHRRLRDRRADRLCADLARRRVLARLAARRAVRRGRGGCWSPKACAKAASSATA